MPDSAQTQKEKDNLARIRENQRRSRARRKEYLQELESKWRACEQKGVEATAEVQAAARQVLEENRRLRALLKDRGISDHEIDNVQLSPVSTGGFSEAMSAAMNLETMLKTRKFVDPNPNDGMPDTRRSSSATKLSASPPMGVQEISPADQRHPQIQIRPRPSYPPQSAAEYHDQHFAWHDPSNLSIPSVPSLTSHSSSSSQHTTPIEAYHGHQNLMYNDNFAAPSCPWPQAYDTHHAPTSYSSVEAANIIRSMGANVAQVADDEELCGVPTDVGVAPKLHTPMIFDAMHRYSHVATTMHP